MEASKFHFYSFGIVAANKPRTNKQGLPEDMIEVYPQETFTMSTGEITDHVQKVDIKGTDSKGNPYEGKIESKVSLTCKWLPIGEPNRVTPPDVRRNERVIIYRYGETQYYFWTSAFNNVIRKLETVAWWWSGTPVDGDSADKKRTGDNGYLLELSSHDKHVVFTTSDKNGEACRYCIEMDLKSGTFRLEDNLGNIIHLDSVGGNLTANINSTINMKTETVNIDCNTMNVNCDSMNVNAGSSVNNTTPIVNLSENLSVGSNASISGSTSVGGGLAVTGGGGSIGGGNTTINGSINISGSVSAGGSGSFGGNVSAPNI